MSLTKQLWLAIAVLILLTFVSGFIVSGYTARSYYVEQLTVKNIDNATGLALSISQMEKDLVLLELMISAQFDTGHYQRIELIGTDGRTLVRREHDDDLALVPDWFGNLMAFDIAPGVAQVQDGWNQFGTLYLASQSSYALANLWRVSYQLLAWFLGIALVCGILGSLLLRRISHPLQDVVAQAEAIGERRFVTSHEPRTLEFRRLVRAMNTLTSRVRRMLEVEAQRLDDMRRASLLDPHTGIANRERFLSILDSRLAQEDKSAQDAVLLLRVTALAELNQQNGRDGTDKFIRTVLAGIDENLAAQKTLYSEYTVGRLNSSDFAIMLTNTESLPDVCKSLWDAINKLVTSANVGVDLPIALVGSYFSHADTQAKLLTVLDNLLAQTEHSHARHVMLASGPKSAPLFRNASAWKEALKQAIADRQISTVLYPSYRIDGSVLHNEAMLRINLAGQLLPAGAVIGWARRLGLLPAFDLQVLQCALHTLTEQTDTRIAVNLSTESLSNSASYLELITLLRTTPADTLQRLSLELDERTALEEASIFSTFASEMKSRGMSIGLQAAGNNFHAISGLEKIGLDYLKVDAALIHQIQNKDAQNLLRGLCKLGHSLGLLMIAEGVQENTEKRLLLELDFDGVTGPGALAVISGQQDNSNV